MYRVGGTQEKSRMGRFLIVSIVFHVLVFLLSPTWEASPIAGTIPGDGVFQFTLRQPTEINTFSLERVTPRPAIPQPGERPTALQPVQLPQQQLQVPERPETTSVQQVAQVPPEPAQANPPPRSQTTVGDPVQLPQRVVPTPPARPEIPSSEATEVPVITSESGSVPVATHTEEASEVSVESTSMVEEGVEEEGTGSDDAEEAIETEEVEAEVAPPPPPPPPPPSVGSMLTFPGGMFIPKNYDRGWGTVSVRVVITVDEHGNVEHAEVDPTMSSTVPAINDWALAYALQLVQAQPGPEGQAYQASFVVRFDPEGGGQGVTFVPNAEELVELLIRN